MVRFYATLLVFIITPFNAYSTPSTLPNDSSSPYPAQEYSLVTPLSVSKNKVQALFRKMRTELPGSEITERQQERDFYRLLVQCYSSITPARKLQAELIKVSKSPFIVYENHSYCVIASSQLDRQAALMEQKKLIKKNIRTEVVKFSLPLTHWQIKRSGFVDLRDAVYIANSISRRGLTTLIEPAENQMLTIQHEASLRHN